MTVDGLETVVYTFQFIVPGYIICEIISALMPRKKYSEGEKMVQAIGYSVLNIGIWYWLFKLLQQNLSTDSVWYWLLNTGIVIITGGITGIIMGILRMKGIFRKVFEHFGINIVHPVPNAWDYKFLDGKVQWMEVTISNGKVIRGLYSTHSMVSSESEYRDIYLEELYTKNNGKWIKVERTSGVWLNPDEIRYIKFYE